VPREPHPVLIVGGGPAGLALALELARQRIDAIVVERGAYRDVRVGEHLAPPAVLQLRALDVTSLDGHLASAGVDAYWGSGEAHHMDYFFHPAQHGLNLCRPQFDADLARAAASRGATILTSAILSRASRSNANWDVDICAGDRTRTFTVSLIVDATGRAATFARRQGARICAQDRQIALVGLCEASGSGSSNTRSVVEASELGWWYRAPIGSDRCICMLVTDDDQLPKARRGALPQWWQDQLGRTRHVVGDARERAAVTTFLVRSARSQCLNIAHGTGWLAIGDAAMAFDPLASQGIAKALDHGKRAAFHISSYLAGDDAALARFALQSSRDYAAYMATRTGYYQLETQWPTSVFWRRRHGENLARA
jgi:flavin-dependent dehydrogenase